MDPSLGPFESEQLHDVNPGDLNVPGEPNHFPEGGVFWTRPVPETSIQIHRGDATFAFSELSMPDWIDVVNAIFRTGPEPIPGTASVDIGWTGTGERLRVRNDAAGFGGTYENATATVEWSVANDEGYFFSTANSSDVTVTHAFTAHVRNGVFHPGGRRRSREG